MGCFSFHCFQRYEKHVFREDSYLHLYEKNKHRFNAQQVSASLLGQQVGDLFIFTSFSSKMLARLTASHFVTTLASAAIDPNGGLTLHA